MTNYNHYFKINFDLKRLLNSINIRYCLILQIRQKLFKNLRKLLHFGAFNMAGSNASCIWNDQLNHCGIENIATDREVNG